MSMRCISCDEELEHATPYTSLAEQQPSNGVILYSHGNYGSTLFDPMDGGATRLELYLCDACLLKKATSVYRVEPGALARDNMYMRFDEYVVWLEGEKNAAADKR